MDNILHENHQGGPNLTLLNVLNALNVLNVLNILIMPKDASLACWALFYATAQIGANFARTFSFPAKLGRN